MATSDKALATSGRIARTGKYLQALGNALKQEHLFLTVFVVGAILRVYNLGYESIWFDEGVSIERARMSVIQMIEVTARRDNNPPLYYLILHYWVALFGDSEFAVRLLSA